MTKNEGGDKPTLAENRYWIVLICIAREIVGLSLRIVSRGWRSFPPHVREACFPLYGADLPESGTREDKALAYGISPVRRHSSTLPSVASLATREI